MQASDHAGLPSCKMCPQGAPRVAARVCRLWLKQAGQGGGGRDDDYVSRSEFRLLLVSCSAVHSVVSFCSCYERFGGVVRESGLQVYLKQYFELFSIFDDIDSGSASVCLLV